MTLSAFDWYLIGINVLGFILFAVNTWLYNKTADGQIDTVLTICSLLGGSLGIVIGILIFERKPVKSVMMSRVFVACVLVIQILIVLMIKGFIGKEITLAFWEFFQKYPAVPVYLLIINVVTLIVYALDKMRALEDRRRIRIVTLLGLAFIGGSVGALIAMYVFRHKTKKDYFTVGVPLIMVMQVVVLFFAMNNLH